MTNNDNGDDDDYPLPSQEDRGHDRSNGLECIKKWQWLSRNKASALFEWLLTT